jgi:hypothetical protein
MMDEFSEFINSKYNIDVDKVIMLNYTLAAKNFPFIYQYIGNGCMRRTFLKPEFLSESIECTIPYNNAFYIWLNNWFKEQFDIELCYNDDRSICWSAGVRLDLDI